ncbi:archaemetzincin family Zn-dependent metalloprotease, partial [bacterium]|nr:archaemetzincin family Zn-dependent metalloprotease [bacterium]
MADLTLVAIGPLPDGMLDELAGALSHALGFPCAVGEAVIDPDPAFDSRREQYDCRSLFPALEAIAALSGGRVLGVADVDLYSAVFTFVFGESQLNGKAAMISLHRLRPEEYGLAGDDALFRHRAFQEAVHEVGHLLGLVHCHAPECVMRFSGSVEEVDLKGDRFCAACEEQSRA